MSEALERLILEEYAACGIYEDLDSSIDGSEAIDFETFRAASAKSTGGNSNRYSRGATGNNSTSKDSVKSRGSRRYSDDQNERNGLGDGSFNIKSEECSPKKYYLGTLRDLSIAEIVEDDPCINMTVSIGDNEDSIGEDEEVPFV